VSAKGGRGAVAAGAPSPVRAVAVRELRAYFDSPIAYVFLTVGTVKGFGMAAVEVRKAGGQWEGTAFKRTPCGDQVVKIRVKM